MDELMTELVELLDGVLAGRGISRDAWVGMLGPAKTGDADVALPCFAFSKPLRMAPPAIASALAEELVAAGLDGSAGSLGSVGAVNGFLNVTWSPARRWASTVGGVIGGVEDWLSVSDASGLLLLEHTSANPNGPFHVGRVRNAILGDTLVRLHRLAGEDVRAEYYVDDMGKQVAILAWALENLSSDEVDSLLAGAGIGDEETAGSGSLYDHPGKEDHARVRWYQAANLRREADPAVEAELTAMIHASEQGDAAMIARFEKAWKPILDGMLATLAELGISYDAFTNESQFILNGDVPAISARFKAHPAHLVADNGAHGLDISELGMEKQEFWFERADGSSLYATRDVAYHVWKAQQAPRLLNVLGEDHRDQAKTVAHALSLVDAPAPECVFYAFIKLPGGKMSTRKGNVVFVDDLLREAELRALVKVQELRPELDADHQASIARSVGRSAVRYDIAKVAAQKGFTFDWERALDFTGDSAPFIIYSHARASSIRRKVAATGVDVDGVVAAAAAGLAGGAADGGAGWHPSLVGLLRSLATFRRVLGEAVRQHRSNLFASALLALAAEYNQFYRDCPVTGDDGAVDAVHLAASEATRLALAAGCRGLGLDALDEM